MNDVIGGIYVFKILLGQYMAVQHCTGNVSGMIWELDVESFRTSCKKKWDSIEILMDVLSRLPDIMLENDRQCQHHWQVSKLNRQKERGYIVGYLGLENISKISIASLEIFSIAICEFVSKNIKQKCHVLHSLVQFEMISIKEKKYFLSYKKSFCT